MCCRKKEQGRDGKGESKKKGRRGGRRKTENNKYNFSH